MSIEDLTVLGVLCRCEGTHQGKTEWRGGMKSMARAQPDEPWISVRVTRRVHAEREHWTVIRKLTFRGGDPDVVSFGERSKARFYFEGQGRSLEEAIERCECAEDWLREARAPE